MPAPAQLSPEMLGEDAELLRKVARRYREEAELADEFDTDWRDSRNRIATRIDAIADRLLAD